VILSLSLTLTPTFRVQKKRSVVIVSKNNAVKEYCIVAKITSVLRGDADEFVLENAQLDTHLSKPSAVRMNQVFTAHESLIIKKISKLKKPSLTRLNDNIKTNFDID
jgi:mRNA-degrading endonuclease toxin of MazEF toxin-antitoxin module